MNNDLISRSALKKKVENLVAGGAEGLKDYYENGTKSDENSWIGGIYDAWELISNAPVVFSCNACKNMGNERECVDCHDYSNYVHYDKRSQGKWIDRMADKGYFECPFCHKQITGGDLNFCVKCGADLRGKENDTKRT